MPTFRGGLSSMWFTWPLTRGVYRAVKRPLMISKGTFRPFAVSGELHVGLVLVPVSWEKHPPASFTGWGFPAESWVKRYNQVLASFSSRLRFLLCYLYFQAASWYLLAVSDVHSHRFYHWTPILPSTNWILCLFLNQSQFPWLGRPGSCVHQIKVQLPG